MTASKSASSREPVAHVSGGGFAWHIELPANTTAALGAAKPRATLVIDSAHEDERSSYGVPLAVARRLEAASPAAGAGPSCRAELLHDLRTISSECCLDRVVRLVDRRDYSCKEVRDKLRLDGYAGNVIDEVIKRACELCLLDDARFADTFIRTKILSGWGSYRIERELSRRGVDPSGVPGWPDAYLEDGDEAERAFELISTKRVSGKNPYEKLVRFLAGRGFSLGVAKQAASRRLAQEDDSTDS